MHNIFSNREDLVKRYADRRKNISEEEVEDLLDCVLGYLKQVTSDNETYAVRIGNLGYMYQKFKPQQKKHRHLKHMNNHLLMDKMIVEVCTNNDTNRNPLIRNSFLDKEYKGMSFQEIEEIQNVED